MEPYKHPKANSTCLSVLTLGLLSVWPESNSQSILALKVDPVWEKLKIFLRISQLLQVVHPVTQMFWTNTMIDNLQKHILMMACQ